MLQVQEMIEVTMNIPAPGCSISGAQKLREMGCSLYETSCGSRFDTLDELKRFVNQKGVIARITVYEESGHRFYYGNGGGRYLHEETFLYPK